MTVAETTPQSDKTPKTPSLRQRKLGIGANVLVQIVAVAALAVMGNWLVSRHYMRFDWTRSRYYQVSEKTKQLLAGLKSPVEVVVFLQPGAESPHVAKVYGDVKDLLKEMQLFGGKNLRVEYVDSQKGARAEQLVDKYKVDSPNVVIFESGGRHKYVTIDEMVDMDFSQMGMGYRIKAFKGEGVFLSAIQTVTEEKPPVVYFLSGHGEHDPENPEPQDGYSVLSQYIKRDNIKVERWNLAEKQALPADAGALVIAGPATKYTPAELAMLDEYLTKQGGRLLVMINPRKDGGLAGWLQNWGVQADNNLAMARGGSLFGTELLVINATGTDYAPQHAITKKLAGINTTFPHARTIRRAEAGPASAAPALVTELVKTPAAFWGETDLDSKRARFDQGQDMTGPLCLAVALEANKPTGVELDGGQFRMVVVGTSGFVDNSSLSEGNLDFFMNSLNWLLKREQLVAVSPKLPQEFRLDMTPKQVTATFAIVVGGLPLLVAVIGLGVWARRRK